MAFKKTPGSEYIKSQKRIRALKSKLENTDPCSSKYSKIEEKIATEKDKSYVAKVKMYNPGANVVNNDFVLSKTENKSAVSFSAGFTYVNKKSKNKK